jgi:hypothetical protein
MKTSATLVGLLKSAPDFSESGTFPAAVEHSMGIRSHWPQPRPPWKNFVVTTALYSLKQTECGIRAQPPAGAAAPTIESGGGSLRFMTLEGNAIYLPNLAAITPERRVISWGGKVTGPECLEARLSTYTRTPARLFRFEVECGGFDDGLTALQFLHRVRRRTTAYAEGVSGGWTRVLAPRLGPSHLLVCLQRVWNRQSETSCWITVPGSVSGPGNFRHHRAVGLGFAAAAAQRYRANGYGRRF